jgi:hypothetical protein
MVELTDDEHLSDEEQWVRHRLESAVGPTRVTDWSEHGGPEGKHDLEAVLPDGKIAAIEIVAAADQARRNAEHGAGSTCVTSGFPDHSSAGTSRSPRRPIRGTSAMMGA